MNNILIAGSTGHIGSFLRRELSKDYNFTYLGNKKNNDKKIISIDLKRKEKILKFVKSTEKFDSLIFF